MVSYIWGIFIVIGVLYSIFTGNVGALNNQVLNGASEGINMVLKLLPMLVLWTGILQIAEDSNLLSKFSNLVKPVLRKLFPSLHKDHKALDYIASNIAANALGLGNAATPFGLKAMSAMQEDNPNKDIATPAMITFLVLNTAGVTIIPTTVIALRLMHGSANPSEIIITSILATICSSAAGLTLDYFLRKKANR